MWKPILLFLARCCFAGQAPVLVLGGGVGGLTSALYLARSGLQPVVIEGKMPGGLITQSHSVQNWPGDIEITGAELADKIREQGRRAGVQFLSQEVIRVDLKKRPFQVVTKEVGEEEEAIWRASSIIIAMGTEPNRLGIPGEKEFWGRGVTNCAICDGSLYRGKKVAVVGGGDAAVLEALYLSNLASEVTVCVRADHFRAQEKERIKTLLEKGNVNILFNTQVLEVKGEDEVQGVMLEEKGKKRSLPVDGLFLAIGSKPNSALFAKELKLDQGGYIEVSEEAKTSVNGVYAVGDIADPTFKQAITAAGSGAKAALLAQQFLSDLVKPVGLVEIESLQQFEEELARGGPLLLDFYAVWCGPCRQISPKIEKSAKEIRVLKIDVDKFPSLAEKYKVKAMPTLLQLDESGKEKERRVGAPEITVLLKEIGPAQRA
jgi:thioredoxin reductase (NADPH)